MDVDKARSAEIAVHNLYGMDGEYTFYYDETNNIRKFRLKETGFNVNNPSNFVLGGVAHEGKTTSSDFQKLMSDLRLPDTVAELKRTHVGNGNFWEILQARKLEIFLEWLLETDLYVHYCNVNIIHWSLVDIVESVLAETGKDLIPHHVQIKNDVTNILQADRGNFIPAALRFGYPNIKKNDLDKFKYSISKILKRGLKRLAPHRAELMGSFMIALGRTRELPFLEGEDEHVLIDDFSPFYRRNLYLYKNSKHIFDNELAVEAGVRSMVLTHNGVQLEHMEFVNSKDFMPVQVSDVIIGLLGKYFTEVRNLEIDELVKRDNVLCGGARRNLDLLRKIMKSSIDKSNGFLNSIATEEEFAKHTVFMYERSRA